MEGNLKGGGGKERERGRRGEVGEKGEGTGEIRLNFLCFLGGVSSHANAMAIL